MTTAICIYCGDLKFGSFCPCNTCGKIPQNKDDVVRSLALSDHYLSIEELKAFGASIQEGEFVQIDSKLRGELASQINQDTLDQLSKLADPELRERYRRRELRIILGLIAFVIAWIGWMIYRFLFS